MAADFLRALLKAIPYKVYTVLTDNGTHFTTPGNQRSAAADIKLALERGEIFRAHAFELACARNDIEHRLTKPKHPWTNGQVERMNRKLKEATIKRYHYETHDQLRSHLADFVTAYNFAGRLKTLKGLTPYEYICKTWATEPQQFTLDPHHQMPGLNTRITASCRPAIASSYRVRAAAMPASQARVAATSARPLRAAVGPLAPTRTDTPPNSFTATNPLSSVTSSPMNTGTRPV